MGKMKHIFLGMTLVATAFGQSATNFDTKVITPATPAPKPAKVVKLTPDKNISAGTVLPSRYVGEAELEPYLSSLSTAFLAGGQERDPFGHYQDPDARPEPKKTIARPGPRAPQKATPLSEIVQLLPITTIMPGEKSFLVGTRKVTVGQELPLIWRGKAINVIVTDVSSQLIAFRNMESGEIASRTLQMFPPGMRAGNGSEEIRAPGMVPDRPNAPIELDTGEFSP
jgi:hypothetical protein